MCSRDSTEPSWNGAANGHIKLKSHDGLDRGYPYMTGRDVVRRGLSGMEKSGVIEIVLLPESCGLSLFNSQDKGARRGHFLGFQGPGSVAFGPCRSSSVQASGSPLLCLFEKEMIQLQPTLTKSEFWERGPGILLKISFPLSPGVLVLVELWECCACDLDDSLRQEPHPRAGFLC